MKKTILAICTLVFVSILSSSAYAITISDNFDDGNADGWSFDSAPAYPYSPGNWRVEDGKLVQDSGYDAVMALYEGLEPTTQEIQATFSNFNDSGYGGIVLWYKDSDNYVLVRMYKGVDGLWVSEEIDGNYEDVFYTYPYPFEPWYTPNTLKVIANNSGNLAIWIDGNFARDHQVQTTERIGRSGVFNGNSGGTIDDFILITDSDEEDGDDTDNDGVNDSEDMCLNTAPDTLKKKLGKDRWVVLNETEYGWYKGKEDKKGRVKPVYKEALGYTYGCSGTQILDMLSGDNKKKYEDQYKHGLKTKTINDFRQKYDN